MSASDDVRSTTRTATRYHQPGPLSTLHTRTPGACRQHSSDRVRKAPRIGVRVCSVGKEAVAAALWLSLPSCRGTLLFSYQSSEWRRRSFAYVVGAATMGQANGVRAWARERAGYPFEARKPLPASSELLQVSPRNRGSNRASRVMQMDAAASAALKVAARPGNNSPTRGQRPLALPPPSLIPQKWTARRPSPPHAVDSPRSSPPSGQKDWRAARANVRAE